MDMDILQDAIERFRNGFNGFYAYSIVLLRRDLYQALNAPERWNGMEVKVTDDENAPIMFLL